MKINLTQEERAEIESIHCFDESILSRYASKNCDEVREKRSEGGDTFIRTAYAIDCDRILHSFLYNRGTDKTQVFSFFKNDDITRRSSHMQLVSRIGRTIGKILRLNLDLIEAIAIGHDVGHTPFGHKGEEFLNDLYRDRTGRFFNHNVHSVRVLQKICGCNLTLQTLDGILSHCGEKVFEHYSPGKISSFTEFYQVLNNCYCIESVNKSLRPGTLEGIVVRISDMIAYIGKDRQDARKVRLLNSEMKDTPLGRTNAEIITSIITDIIRNSMNQSYIAMSKEVWLFAILNG